MRQETEVSEVKELAEGTSMDLPLKDNSNLRKKIRSVPLCGHKFPWEGGSTKGMDFPGVAEGHMGGGGYTWRVYSRREKRKRVNPTGEGDWRTLKT